MKSYLPAAIASAAVIAVAVAFANFTSTGRLTDNALELHHTNSLLGTAALARAAAGQASLFDELEERGVASAEATGVAWREHEEIRSSLRELAEGTTGPLASDLDGYLAALSADPIDRETMEAAYGTLAERLRDRITVLEEEIERSGRFGNQVSGAIRLLVVLVIPAAALVTYRRRTAVQLKEARLRWQAQVEAEREINRAKDRFIAGISHEMRTPLTGICGFSEMLLDTPADAPLDREAIRVINGEAADLARMVDDFIVTSRLDGETLAMQAEPVDVTELVRVVAQRFQRRGVRIDVEGEHSRAVCDPARTIHILTNLASNAVRHGGDTITATVESDGTLVRCHVTDDGHGVPPEVEHRLFTRYVYDGDQAVKTGSLGLGTWVARELARSMGGDVTFRREEGSTVFTLALPAAMIRGASGEAAVRVGSQT